VPEFFLLTTFVWQELRRRFSALFAHVADLDYQSQIDQENYDAEAFTKPHIGVEALAEGTDCLSAELERLKAFLHGFCCVLI
jgi:hypothetical protein